jgi:hypothetical protein
MANVGYEEGFYGEWLQKWLPIAQFKLISLFTLSVRKQWERIPQQGNRTGVQCGI